MSLKTAVFVCGLGNVGFASTFLKTIGMDETGDYAPIMYIEDTASGCDFRGFEYLFRGRFDGILKHAGRGGCNALWTQAVQWGASENVECLIVANDDIMAPKPGVIDQMVRVLEQNSHIAMVGVGSNGAWESDHKVKERWFVDPSLLLEAAAYCEEFRGTPVKYSHHVSGPLWACRPKLWLESGGIPANLFWGWGEIVPSIELRKMGYESAAVQWPVTILHYGGGAFYDIHSDKERHDSFTRRSQEMGDEGKYIFERYGNGHAHLMAQHFDEKLPSMNLPPILYDPPEMV